MDRVHGSSKIHKLSAYHHAESQNDKNICDDWGQTSLDRRRRMVRLHGLWRRWCGGCKVLISCIKYLEIALFTWCTACFCSGSNSAIRSSCFDFDTKWIDDYYSVHGTKQRPYNNQDLRTEGKGVVGIQSGVACPESGTAGLVKSIHIRIRATALCGRTIINKNFRVRKKGAHWSMSKTPRLKKGMLLRWKNFLCSNLGSWTG